MINRHPESLKVLEMSKAATMKEFKPILHGLHDKVLSAKDIHNLYYNPQTGKFDRGLKTIYRYIEKLKEEGLIMEAGQRMTEGSRVVETLYCATARIFFFEGPEVMEQWKTPESKEFLLKMKTLLELYREEKYSEDEFLKFAWDYFDKQDKISSKLIQIAQDNENILEMLKDLPPSKISKLIFNTTHFAILKKNEQK